MTNKNIRQRCNALLTAMLGSSELVNAWWDNPNKAFDGETPDVVFVLEPMKVYQYLMTCSEGGW
jgi:hypothetical protein